MYDSIIIGAGVTGASVARELSKYDGKFLVIEKTEDVCTGTSKANTAIIHGGYDAKPGSMKAKMNVRGTELAEVLSKEIGFPYQKRGTIVVCRSEKDRPLLQKLYDRGIQNGVKGLQIIEQDKVRELEPNINDDVICALYCSEAGISNPFLINIAMAENAHANGVDFNLNEEVVGFEEYENYWIVYTSNGKSYKTRSVVNAAGLYADVLHNMVSDLNDKLSIHPRRGEYYLCDKEHGNHINHTIFDLPTEKGKGIVVTPTVDGNLLIGPTSTFQDSKEDKITTQEDLNKIREGSALTTKNLPYSSVIRSFSGLRAHEEKDDFVIREVKNRFYDCSGIESPGLSSCFAIGEYVSNMVSRDLNLNENSKFNGHRDPIIQTNELTEEEHQLLIKNNPKYSKVICRCESVTEQEIIDAIRRPLGAKTVDGIKRRVRASAGRCQGGFCLPKLIEILSRELDIPMEEVVQNEPGSNYTFGKLK